MSAVPTLGTQLALFWVLSARTRSLYRLTNSRETDLIVYDPLVDLVTRQRKVISPGLTLSIQRYLCPACHIVPDRDGAILLETSASCLKPSCAQCGVSSGTLTQYILNSSQKACSQNQALPRPWFVRLSTGCISPSEIEGSLAQYD
jgi:hypothetical protein